MTDRAMREAFEKVTNPNFKWDVSPETIDDHWQTFQEAWAASQAHTRKEIIEDVIVINGMLETLKNADWTDISTYRDFAASFLMRTSYLKSLSQPTKG